MSWDNYVTNLISGGLKDVALLDNSGNLLAASPALSNLPVEDRRGIFESLKDPNFARRNGLILGGVRYIVLNASEGCIHTRRGSSGALVYRSKTVVILGIHDEKMQLGNASKLIETTISFLIEQNY
eukprot:TRINITY_DN1943_c0_g1_i1.p1 TRINITY_DN1943_c0_g1~~TRINITY_DN1943_c0_g1_i1.p1  ORF type:complete len:138 (+),score=23.06 TRINITY_DN1943_c0_g1_i1:39-416(+)